MYPTTIQLDNRDLANRVAKFLNNQQMPGVNTIDIRAVGGVVVLSGQLRTEREKRLYVQYCQRVAGVMQVIDELQVTQQKCSTGQPSTASVS
jgi:osmotically-inducible protein OsmY